MQNLVLINTSLGQIKYSLDTKAANSTYAFIDLALKGIMNNHKIMRVVKDFVIQPVYDEEKECVEYSFLVKGEYKTNDFDNRDMQKYDLCLAGDGKVVSSPACYFICLSETAANKLNQKYTVIGSLLEGKNVIDKIANLPTKKIDIGLEKVIVEEPIDDIRIDSIEIKTQDIILKKPLYL